MTRKCHNHPLQTNPRQCKEETGILHLASKGNASLPQRDDTVLQKKKNPKDYAQTTNKTMGATDNKRTTTLKRTSAVVTRGIN